MFPPSTKIIHNHLQVELGTHQPTSRKHSYCCCRSRTITSIIPYALQAVNAVAIGIDVIIKIRDDRVITQQPRSKHRTRPDTVDICW